VSDDGFGGLPTGVKLGSGVTVGSVGSGPTFAGAGEEVGETEEEGVRVVAVPLSGLQRLPSERFLRVTGGTGSGSGEATRAATAR